MGATEERALEAYARGVVVPSNGKEYAYYLGNWFVFKQRAVNLTFTILPQDLVVSALGADVVIDVLLSHDENEKRRVMYVD